LEFITARHGEQAFRSAVRRKKSPLNFLQRKFAANIASDAAVHFGDRGSAKINVPTASNKMARGMSIIPWAA
jgi:hypothetical protein